MESKHFSHHHPLTFHHLPEPSHHHCSCCKSPATGNVYACWQCCYFLHDQCFRATRSINHPSHPLHPLTLLPFPTYPSSSFICNSCNLAGDAFCYSCSACEFDLHLHCALHPNANPDPHPSSSPVSLYPPPSNADPNPVYPPPPPAYPTPENYIPPANPTTANSPPPPPPQPTAVNAAATAETSKHFSHPHELKQMEIEISNAKVCSACECRFAGAAYVCTERYCTFNLHKSCFESPREVDHKSHLHRLTLLTAPPFNTNGSFTCDACRKTGEAFVYTCSTCSYDLHIDCIRWWEAVSRPDHAHDLSLCYKSPVAGGEVLVCSVCREGVDEKGWVYYCRECGFGTHLECVKEEIKKVDAGGGAPAAGYELKRYEEELYSFQAQKMQLDLQLQMAKAQADMMNSFANSFKNFF